MPLVKVELRAGLRVGGRALLSPKVPPDATLQDLLENLRDEGVLGEEHLQKPNYVVATLGDRLVLPAEWPCCRLEEGDEITLFPPLSGG